MNVVIVPSHNQGKNISRIIKGYENQTILPDLVLFVFDRCADSSRADFISLKTKLNIRCIIKNVGDNFSAGMTRDFGVDYVLQNFPEYKTIIFTDGDCVPSPKLVELHLDCLNNSSKPAVSCGRRIMMSRDELSFDEDERINNFWTNDYSFTDKNSRLLISNRVTIESIFTYSCNLAFNRGAIDLCRKINLQISNSPRVFNPEFDGSWGGEDNFVSDCLFRTGNNILLTSKYCYVQHIWHEQASKDEVKTKKMIHTKLSSILKQLIIRGDIPGDFTIFEKNRNIGFDNAFNTQLSNIKTIQKEENGFELLNKIKFPEELNERDLLICKYVISRNRLIVPANENNSRIPNIDDRIKRLYDFLTFCKCYLINDEILFEDSNYKELTSEQINHEMLLNSSKRT